MIDYMLSLKGISDPLMPDGTTALAMALARQDLKSIGLLLKSGHECGINPKTLIVNAIKQLDLGHIKHDHKLREVMMNGLKDQRYCCRHDKSNKPCPCVQKKRRHSKK